MVIDNNDVDEKAIKWKIKYHAMRATTKHKSKIVETSVKSILSLRLHHKVKRIYKSCFMVANTKYVFITHRWNTKTPLLALRGVVWVIQLG
jgi:hypothetical protein